MLLEQVFMTDSKRRRKTSACMIPLKNVHERFSVLSGKVLFRNVDNSRRCLRAL